MKKIFKQFLVTSLSIVSVACCGFGVNSAMSTMAEEKGDAVYKSASFTDNFSEMEETTEKLFSTENVTVKNGEIAQKTYGAGVVVSDDTSITTNMGFDEFDLYLTLSDDTTNGDGNKRGPVITFGSGNEYKYDLYLVGSYYSLGSWLYKDGVNLAPDWVMMPSASESCKYKIEIREGSVSVKHWSEDDADYVHTAAFPYYLESEEISNVAGYITIEKCSTANGNFVVNEMSIDPIAEDVEPTACVLDNSSIKLGEKGTVKAEVEINEDRFVGVFINGNIVDASMYKLSSSGGMINQVSINTEAFAFEYSKDTSIRNFDLDIIARDEKFSATVNFTIGEVEIQLVDSKGDAISTQNVAVGATIADINLSDEYISYGLAVEKRGADGKTRSYISSINSDYSFYKDIRVYCLTADYKCSVYLFTYDNFSEWNDAIKVEVPCGMTFADYLQQVNSDEDTNNDVVVANPYGLLFTNWDYDGEVLQDMDIHAEYYTLKGNGQDFEITFDKQPANAELKKVLLIQGSGSVTYDGNMNIPNGHVWNAIMSPQRYTDFEYSVDIKKMDGVYTDDWSFMIAFGAPNYDQAYPWARKFGLSFKNTYSEETKKFYSQVVVTEGGDNVTNYSSRVILQTGLKTTLATDSARIVQPITFYDRNLFQYNSGLSDDNYVSIKIKVVDQTLTLYMKSSNAQNWTEEASCQLSYDTSGYVTYFQSHTEANAFDTLLSIDNICIKNLADEQHEISVTRDGMAYDSQESVLTHKIGEKEEGNDIVFDYISRYQAFVGTRYTICDKDWKPIVTQARDISAEILNGETLARKITFSDKVLSEIYQEHRAQVYGADNTLNVIVNVLTDNDYAEIYMKLNVQPSYKMYVKENATAEEKTFAGAGAFAQELDFSKYTEYFAEYTKPSEGYDFKGWKDLYEGTIYGADEKVSIYKNMTIVPHFERKSYTVKFVDEEGTVYDEKTVLHGDNSELPTFIPESDKGKFVKWADDYKAVTSDRSVLAIFDDSGNDSPVEESGCKSSINTGMTALTLAFVATFIFHKKKKNDLI